MPKFNYPVKNPFEARAVTEPTFKENAKRNDDLMVELEFALTRRTSPNITMIRVEDRSLQQVILGKLKTRLSEYRFYDIDLTPHKVISLHKALQRLLPAEVLSSPSITYCVNVFGLENCQLIFEDGEIVESGMIAQLNYEREIVFRRPNYLTIVWSDHDFFTRLQQQAPDFWSWITYYFEFRKEDVEVK